MTGSFSSIDVVLTAIPEFLALDVMGSNWPPILMVWILNPILLYKRLTWIRDCMRVAVFALVTCSDVLKLMCWEMVKQKCAPLKNVISEHRITMTYFNLMKVGKEETVCLFTADSLLLYVLPCSDCMLGPKLSSFTLTCYLVMWQFFSSWFSTIFSNVLVLILPMVCWKLRAV